MGFPVFSRGLSINGTNKFQPGQVGVPVVLGGIVVRTSDIIVGDRDGLVVVLAEEVESAIEASEDPEATREQMLDAVKKQIDKLATLEGPPLVEAFKALRGIVQKHVADEEKNILPALGEAAI